MYSQCKRRRILVARPAAEGFRRPVRETNIAHRDDALSARDVARIKELNNTIVQLFIYHSNVVRTYTAAAVSTSNFGSTVRNFGDKNAEQRRQKLLYQTALVQTKNIQELIYVALKE